MIRTQSKYNIPRYKQLIPKQINKQNIKVKDQIKYFNQVRVYAQYKKQECNKQNIFPIIQYGNRQQKNGKQIQQQKIQCSQLQLRNINNLQQNKKNKKFNIIWKCNKQSQKSAELIIINKNINGQSQYQSQSQNRVAFKVDTKLYSQAKIRYQIELNPQVQQIYKFEQETQEKKYQSDTLSNVGVTTTNCQNNFNIIRCLSTELGQIEFHYHNSNKFVLVLNYFKRHQQPNYIQYTKQKLWYSYNGRKYQYLIENNLQLMPKCVIKLKQHCKQIADKFISKQLDSLNDNSFQTYYDDPDQFQSRSQSQSDSKANQISQNESQLQISIGSSVDVKLQNDGMQQQSGKQEYKKQRIYAQGNAVITLAINQQNWAIIKIYTQKNNNFMSMFSHDQRQKQNHLCLQDSSLKYRIDNLELHHQLKYQSINHMINQSETILRRYLNKCVYQQIIKQYTFYWYLYVGDL